MKIQVTEADIRYGIQGNCLHCPVARALKRALEHTKYVAQIFCHDVELFERVEDPDEWDEPIVVALPSKAQQFIRDFDHGIPVQPFTFDLDWPEEEQRAPA